MIDIKFERLTIFGHGERRTIAFSTGLNVVIGQYASGKTSLLELLRYGLGGGARLSEAVQSGASSIVLDVRLAGVLLSFERRIGDSRINVTQGGDPVTVLHATSGAAKGTTLASTFLLEALGLEVMKVRRSKSGGSAAETISFWDIYRYAYVSQDDMGQSIAGHTDSNLNRKRKRAFEFMFGLLSPRLVELELADATTVERLAAERKRLADVSRFLNDAHVPTRAQVLEELRRLDEARRVAAEQMDSLRSDSRTSTRSLSTERDRVGELHRRRADLQLASDQLHGEIEARRRLAAQLTLDIERIERLSDSTELISPIEFYQCPRCLQALDSQRVDASHCLLCTQALPAHGESGYLLAEIERLRSVRREVEDLQVDDEIALKAIVAQAGSVALQLSRAEDRLRVRTDSYVAPLFEQIASLSSTISEADTDTRRLNLVLSQWDASAEIQKVADGVESDLERVREEIADEQSQLEVRRGYVREFSNVFDEILQELEIAWYSPASIDSGTYLPKVGGGALSGGQRTVVSVAYHLALLTMGLVHPGELRVPSLLILDTPSKYLGMRDADQVARDYRRIAAIVGAYDTPVQIVIADNSPPPAGVRPDTTIELSYEDPLVPGYEHLGPDAVDSIHQPYDEDDG